MKLTICGSIAFYDKMLEIKSELEKVGNEVKLPPIEVEDENGNKMSVKEYYQMRKQATDDNTWVWDRKEKAMRKHFQKIEWADAILILNYDKNNIKDYIGGNTLLEMGVAFHLNKKIFTLNKIPEISYKEEILGIKPIILNGDLSKIK